MKNEAHGQTVGQRVGEEVVGAWAPCASDTCIENVLMCREAPKAKAERPLPLAPVGSYRDGSPRLLSPRAAKKARKAVIQDSSDDEDSSNDTAKQRTRWRQGGFST